MTNRLKVIAWNMDGKNQLLVAAKSKKEAMALMGAKSAADFNNYANEMGEEGAVAVATAEPGKVFVRPYGGFNKGWQPYKGGLQ